jgi:hypothetical protein
MNRNLTWLEKEIKKDKNEVATHKINTIREILNVSKKDITQGPIKIKKDTLWKRIWNQLKALFKH